MDPERRAAPLRQALDLLAKARLCHVVRASACTGVPLGAEVRQGVVKAILLDVGLVSAALGLSPQAILAPPDMILANEGALAEQAVGQALRAAEPSFKEPALVYWTSEQRGSQAEIDYVIEHGARVVPVEVKAGTTGRLKSLHLFMALRRLPLAVRFNADMPSVVEVNAKTTTGHPARYQLLSLPLYVASEIHRWIAAVAGATPATAA
ncbi:MAG: DUF4143 domain-containing protein [Deltaproteobacteria bacterium]|nr:DUF4143 domain-containing protein [Deltaproteobacteria bacterium]